MSSKPIKADEVDGWVTNQFNQYLLRTPVEERTTERLATIRVKITNDYFRSLPEGLVMIQSILDRLLVWPTSEQPAQSA